MSARGPGVPPPVRILRELEDTDELRQWAQANAPGLDLKYEIIAFREYCFQEVKHYEDFGQAFRSRLLIGRGDDGAAAADAPEGVAKTVRTVDGVEVTDELLAWARANVPGADPVKELKAFRWYCVTLGKDYPDFAQAFRSFLQATAG